MSIGWSVSVGYLTNGKYDEAWSALKSCALDIAQHPDRIYTEALKFGASRYVEGWTLLEVCETFAAKEGNPFSIVENDGDGYVFVMASGGGQMRSAKEHTRRAFCRLLIYEMHGRGFDVNLHTS